MSESQRVLGRSFKGLAVLFLLLVSTLVAGCLDDGPTNKYFATKFPDAYSAEDSWLVYWYICGSDLESNFGAATVDIAELTEAKLPANVKVLIQTGGAVDWQNDLMPDGAIGRYIYDADGLHEIGKLPDADMGAPETLVDFLRYGKENFTADHRVFVFWDHGGGSASGVCIDERTGSFLDLNDIRAAFTAVHSPSPENPPFEMIGFDTCLMATYDTANMIQGLARYMTASEEIEPGNGWEYTGWVGTLGQNPAMGGAALGQVICDSYMEGCKEYGTEDAATLSVIDLEKLSALRTAYESFGIEALRHAKENPQGFFSSFGRDAKQAENYGGNTRNQGYANMVDLGDLAKGTSGILPETSQSLVRAIDDAVIYKVHGDYRDKGNGLSGFYSYDGDAVTFSRYAEQDAAPLPIKCLYHYLIYGQMPPEAEKLLAGGTLENSSVLPAPQLRPSTGLFSVATLEDLPVDIDAEGNSFVRLSQQQMDMLSSIHCQMFYIDTDDDVILYLGSDADVVADWESGMFKDNFRGVWPMLDGHPVYVEITSEEDGYNIYSVPIKLNGTECNLQVVYTFADEKYHILGARKGIDSHGMADRNFIRLKQGDKITTIHYGMTISGNDEEFQPVEVETFTIGSRPEMKDETLGDGSYGYLFEFISPNGDSAMSKVVEFLVKKGNITTMVDK